MVESEPNGWKIVIGGHTLPIEALDYFKLRSNGIIGVRDFESRMRALGVRRVWAWILLGKYERKEFVVVTETGETIEGKDVGLVLSTNQYYFVWVFRLNYNKRKHHEIHLEIQVEGTIEKHRFARRPEESEIQEMLDNRFLDAIDSYFSEFWGYKLRGILDEIRKSGLGDYSSGFDEWRLDRVILKKQTEPLEYNLIDVRVYLSRHEEEPLEYRKDLSRDLEPFIDSALASVIEEIEFIEFDELRKSLATTEKVTKEYVRKMKEWSNYRKLRRLISVATTEDEFENVRKLINEYYVNGKITEEHYEKLQNYLNERVSIVLESYYYRKALEWCDRIRECESLGELNQTIKRIMQTKTFNSPLFDKFREIVDKCYKEKSEELSKLVKEKKPVVFSYYLNQIESILSRGITDPRIVRDLEKLLNRIRKSKIKENWKKELERIVSYKLAEVIKKKCDHFRNLILKCRNLKELRSVNREVRVQKSELEECYEELVKLIEERRKVLAKETYRKLVNKIVEELKKTDKERRPDVIMKYVNDILKLPAERQFELFKRLINLAKSTGELGVISYVINMSEIGWRPQYYELKKELTKMIGRKSIELSR